MNYEAYQKCKTFMFGQTKLTTQIWGAQLLVTYDFSVKKKGLNSSTIEWNINQVLN